VNLKQLEIIWKKISYLREVVDRDSFASGEINLTLDELDALVLKELMRLVWERYLEDEEFTCAQFIADRGG